MRRLLRDILALEDKQLVLLHRLAESSEFLPEYKLFKCIATVLPSSLPAPGMSQNEEEEWWLYNHKYDDSEDVKVTIRMNKSQAKIVTEVSFFPTKED